MFVRCSVKDANKLTSGISPWLPFREPTECAAAYTDPRVILKSRAFLGAALVILEKAARGQIPEDVMALIVFLLDQAVTISERREFQVSLKIMVLRRLKILSIQEPRPYQCIKQVNDMNFDKWYLSDCLFENLTTSIHKIVLTPPPEVTPMTYNSDSDIEWENSEVETEMTDVNPDGATNILMLQDSEGWNQPGTDLMLFVPQDQNSPDFEPNTEMLALPPSTSMEVDRMTVAVPRTSTPEHPALTTMVQLPAITAGNEVAWPWIENNASSTELVPSTSTFTHQRSYRRRPTLEGVGSSPPTVELNESIISLLLKLHCQLSGVADSYKPEEEDEEETEWNSSIGDGPFFIGKLLRKISRLDENCKNFINEARLRLWPSQEERDEARKQRENREREERRRRAKERQQKLMEEFASRQRQFMEKAMESDEHLLGV